MATVNEQLRDFGIGHQVDLFQYSNNVVRRIIALLNRTDSDIAKQLQLALEQLPAGQFTVERLEFLLATVKATNAQAYQAIGAEMTSVVRELAEYEAWYQAQLFEYVMPPQVVASVGVATVNVQQAYAAALARPFQGRLLREWVSTQEATRMLRLRDEVRKGFVAQETVQQIVRRVVGTKANKYADGVMQIDRRSAENVVRTAISHTAATVRDQMFEDNSSIIKALSWSATLDTRTSDICRPRDGKLYQVKEPHKPIGHKFTWAGGPGKAHWNCRSSAVPVTKSWKELTGTNLPEFTPSSRASMDGTVPSDLSFSRWLGKQSASRQIQVLGPQRYELYKTGKYELEDFYNDKGRYLSISELRSRDAATFGAQYWH
jgi:SPP1 gp7 family putative phage head morphogenesis protein